MIGGFVGNPIGGVVNNGNFYLAVTTGSYTLTGIAAAFTDQLSVPVGSYALTGQAITFADKLASVTGSYALTGNAAAFNDSLAAATGSYTLTGQAATFAGKEIVVSGVYALTGNATSLATGEPAASGAYALTGLSIAFSLAMPCAAGAYALSGSPAPHSEVINGADGSTIRRHGRAQVRLLARKIAVKGEDGSTRRVGLLDRFRPPPPFVFPPDWVMPLAAAPIGTPHPVPVRLPAQAPALPDSLTSLPELRDEDDLEAIGIVMAAPDPLADQVTALLALLQQCGALKACSAHSRESGNPGQPAPFGACGPGSPLSRGRAEMSNSISPQRALERRTETA